MSILVVILNLTVPATLDSFFCCIRPSGFRPSQLVLMRCMMSAAIDEFGALTIVFHGDPSVIAAQVVKRDWCNGGFSFNSFGFISKVCLLLHCGFTFRNSVSYVVAY